MRLGKIYKAQQDLDSLKKKKKCYLGKCALSP